MPSNPMERFDEQPDYTGSLKAYYREVSNSGPLLSAAVEYELGCKVQRGREVAKLLANQPTVDQNQLEQWQAELEAAKEAAHKLVTSNLRLVLKFVRSQQVSSSMLPDLIGAGNAGLLRASTDYNPQLYKTRFSTYAWNWIMQAVNKERAEQRSIGIPLYMQTLMRKYLHCAEHFLATYGRAATEEEVAASLQLKVEKVQSIKRALSIQTISADTPLYQDQETGETLVSQLPSPELEISGQVENQVLVEQVLKQLDRKQRQVIERLYGLAGYSNYSHKQLASLLKCSRQEIANIEQEALRQLKQAIVSGGGSSPNTYAK